MIVTARASAGLTCCVAIEPAAFARGDTTPNIIAMIGTHIMNALAVTALVCAATCSAIAAPAQNHPAAHRTFLLIHTPSLQHAAQEWAKYRASEQGGKWEIVLHQLKPPDDESALRLAIREFIRDEHTQAAPSRDDQFAVLLLGDCDPKAPTAGIPAWYFPQIDSVMRSGDGRNDCFATDHPYQLMDDEDDVPDIALGRIPAPSNDEALAALNKIKSYEAPPTLELLQSRARARIVYTAGEGRFGMMDGVLEELFKTMVDRMVPDAFDLSMIYAKPSSIYCPPPSKLKQSVIAQLESGALLFNYIGHGYETGFDSLHWGNKRYPILNVGDLQKRIAKIPVQDNPTAGAGTTLASTNPNRQLNGSGASVTTERSLSPRLMPIAFLSCCSVGWFDLPGSARSFAEELLFNASDASAVAVISGSRITHPFANTVMQMNITKSLLVDRAPTVGLLDLRATQAMTRRGVLDRQLDAIASPIARAGKWETSLADLRKMHVKLYNLIGDPATRIAHTSSQISNLKYENGIIGGEIPEMKTGRVYITLETARTSFAEPEKIQYPLGDNDPDLETKAANNFGLVNHRVLSQIECEVIDGKFSFTLKDPPASKYALLRAYAVGNSADRFLFDAASATRISAAPPPILLSK
jgi:hypothetical protein